MRHALSDAPAECSVLLRALPDRRVAGPAAAVGVTLSLALTALAWGVVGLVAAALVYVAMVAVGALAVGILWIVNAVWRRRRGDS